VVRRRLDALGIKLVSVVEGQPDLLGYDVQAVVADHYRREFARRSADGMNRAAREGRYCGGIVPLGYRIAGRKQTARLVPDETEIWQGLSAAGMRAEAVELFVSGVRSPQAVERLRGTPMREAIAASAHPLSYDAAVINRAVIPYESAAAIRVPTLLAHGAASCDYMRTTALELARIIPDARYIELPDQGHEPAPRALGPVLADYFGGGK
jgi:pimeloyl-ACP methyl ester carboxylesterase